VLDQERAAIEKIKIKQEKEVQKMIEANISRKQVEARNAEKLVFE
jgi:hypothetical protein